MGWIGWGLVSALLTACRYLYIRRMCRTVPSDILLFVTRGVGALVFGIPVVMGGSYIGSAAVFWPVLMLTAVLTAVATLMQMSVIKRYPLSRSVPYFSFIPLFMVPWAAVLLGELPGMPALAGIAVTCTGAFLLNRNEGGIVLLGRNARYMLAGAVILGLTTVCDKLAIGASSVAAYAFVWTAVSFLLHGGIMQYRSRGVRRCGAHLRDPHVYVQALFWAGAFYAQMAGIRSAFHIISGVTFVKLLTMFHILFAVAAGAVLFRERHPVRNLAAALLMVGGAVLVVLGRRM